MQEVNVAVVGASGYTGLELIKMLISHPKFRISYLATSEGRNNLSSLHPSLEGVVESDIRSVDIDRIVESSQLVFLALPHKASMLIAKKLIENGLKVVDFIQQDL